MVLVPAEAPSTERVPLVAEQTVEQIVRSSSMGARISLLRVLRPGTRSGGTGFDDGAGGMAQPACRPGGFGGTWPGCGAGGPITDPLDFAQRTAPVIAGVAGLWAGLEQTPFDTLEILPGQTVRAVRAFYRRLDSSEVEERLRAQLFDPAGRLPLPRGGEVPVVYVEDVAAATQTMARGLWTKHRDLLRGPRLSVGWRPSHLDLGSIEDVLEVHGRRAAAGAGGVVVGGDGFGVVGAGQHGAGHGVRRRDSAFAVVTNTDVANWQDLGRADTLNTALGGAPPQHLAQQDLSALWMDFVAGALTLADEGVAPRGWSRCRWVPGSGCSPLPPTWFPVPLNRFRRFPRRCPQSSGSARWNRPMCSASPTCERLQRAYSDPAAGVEARTAGTELEGWQRVVSKGYAWQVGSILADFCTAPAARSPNWWARSSRPPSGCRPTSDCRRASAIGVILKTFFWALVLVLVVLAGIAAAGWVRWPFALWTGGVMLGLYILASLALFLFSQRDLFAETHLRQSQLGELETMQANLRAALQDVQPAVDRVRTAAVVVPGPGSGAAGTVRAAPARGPHPGSSSTACRARPNSVSPTPTSNRPATRARDSAAPVPTGLADPAVAGHDQRGGSAAT